MSTAAALSETGNDRITMGGNRAPYEIVFEEIGLYYDEARNWASDGFKIENQEQADEIDRLDKELLKLYQEAEALRIEEKRPLDEQIDAIQARYNPFIHKEKGKVALARSSLKALLTAWRQAERDRLEAEAARKRAEFEAEQEAARQAMQASNGDLAAREQAEQIVTSAKQAERAAKAAEKAASTGLRLRTVRSLKVTDPTALAKWLWQHHRPQVEEAHAAIARRLWNTSAPALPGTEVHEDHKAV